MTINGMAAPHDEHWERSFYANDANFRLENGKDYCRTCGRWVQGRATEMRGRQKQANRRKGLASKQAQVRTDIKSRAKTVRTSSGRVATTEPLYLPARTAAGRRGEYRDQQERAGAEATRRKRTRVGKPRRAAAKPYRPRHAAITPGYGY